MPRYHVRWPPEGYQIAQRTVTINGQEALRYFLQRLSDASENGWQDVGGPYKQRGSAMERLRREAERDVRQHRMAGDEIWHDLDERLGLPQPEAHDH